MISKLFFLTIVCSTIINFNNNILSIENYNIPNEVTLDNGGRQIFNFPQSMKIDPCPVYNLFFKSEASAALSNSQIRSLRDSSAICYSLPRWTTEQIQNIAIEAISILDPTALSGFISPEIIAKFLPNQIAALTPAQIKTLKPNQIEALIPTQFLALTPTQIPALTVSQVAVLTPVKIAVLTSTQIPALTSPQIAALTQAQIAALTSPQMAALTTVQIPALTPAQIPALAPVQISALTTVQIPALTPAQIPALTVSQIQALTEKQIRGFQTTPIKQIVAFTPDQISNFSISQMKSLTAEQFLTLIPSQIAKISNQCLPEIINQLSNTQISGLTNEQIVSLPADKLSAFIIARDILVLINKIIPELSTNMAKVPTLTLEAQNKIKPYLNSNQVFEEIFKVALLDQTPAADVLNLLKRLVYLKAEYYVSSNLTYQKLLDLASKILGAITDPAQSSNGKIKTYEDAIVNKSGDTSFVFWYSLLLDYPSTKDYVNLFLDISARTVLTADIVSLIKNIIKVLNPSDESSKSFRLSQLYCFDASKTIANTSILLSQAKTIITSNLSAAVSATISDLPSSLNLKTTTTDFLVARKNELLENQTEGLWDASKLSPLYSAAARPSSLDTGKLMSMFSFWGFVKQWSNLLIRFDFEKYKLLSIISSFKSSLNSKFNSMLVNAQTNSSPQIYLIKNVLDDISKEAAKINAVKTIPFTSDASILQAIQPLEVPKSSALSLDKKK